MGRSTTRRRCSARSGRRPARLNVGSGNESCVKQPFAKTKGYRHTLPLPLFDTASASVL